MSEDILIVEDDAVIAADLASLISSHGFKIAGQAADSATARMIATQANVDIALVDLNLLDGQTGYNLGQELSDDHGISVVYLTANADELHKQHYPTALGVIEKPAPENVIVQAIIYALAQRKAVTSALIETPPINMQLL